MLRHQVRFAVLAIGALCSLSCALVQAKPRSLPQLAYRTVLEIAGDPRRPAKLEVILALPAAKGRFPLVIWNHGSNSGDTKINSSTVDDDIAVYYFLSRGYAVGMPLMRGFGNSGGTIADTGCQLDELGRNAAIDIEAVIDQLAKRPEIDAHRVIAAGVSLGGWNSLAVGALRNSRVVGIVNVYGGVRSSVCNNGDEALKRGSRSLGAMARVPSLWFYGDNDRLWSKPLWQAMHREYVAGGARADLIAFGTFGSDAHRFLNYTSSLTVFGPKVDNFLNGLGLPSTISYPEYMPPRAPPATGYAAIDDVEAVPFLTDAARDAYRKFIAEPTPRAFVIAPGKGVRFEIGGFDPLARALAACRQAAGTECWPYAVDGNVTWAHPPPSPAVTRFAALADVNALPFVNEEGRAGYRRFLNSIRPRAFVIAPDGTWATSTGTLDPVANAVAACTAQGRSCRAYAVDGSVVWPDVATAR